jgi:hypothetical protein
MRKRKISRQAAASDGRTPAEADPTHVGAGGISDAELALMMGIAEFLAWAHDERGVEFTEGGERASYVRMVLLLGEYLGVELTYEGRVALEEAARAPENPLDFMPKTARVRGLDKPENP